MKNLKAFIPHLAAFFILMAVAFIYFLPSVGGKVLIQTDNVKAMGMQAEMRKINDETGKLPLWTNSAFGGMPTYQLLGASRNNLMLHFYRAFVFYNSVRSPHTAFFLMMVCFYILLITIGTDWRLAIPGAIAFAFSTNHVLLAEAGHSTKIMALAYTPLVLAGALLVFRKKFLIGGALFTFALGLQIAANHFQITYYLFLFLGILGLVLLVDSFREKKLPEVLKMAGILIAGTLIAFSSNTTRLWTTQEYSEETIRGKSELSSREGESGLTKGYVFDWSYGIGESFTLMFAGAKGGGGSKKITNTKSFKQFGQGMIDRAVQQGRDRKSATENVSLQLGSSLYWGGQPFTAGPMHYGAIVCFLFLLGAFLIRGPLRTWLLISLGVILVLSWGDNFAAVNYFLYEHFPFYNKFRAVKMILGFGSIVCILMGMMGLKELFDPSVDQKRKEKSLMYSTGGAVLLGVLALISGYGAGFIGPNDAQLDPSVAEIFVADRKAMMMTSVFRSLFLIALVAGTIWMFLTKKLRATYAVLGIGALMFIDIMSVDWSYLDHSKFKPQASHEEAKEPLEVDKQIMTDTDLSYRVLDVARGGLTGNAITSYFHKSLSGYHAAKLMIYQELIEGYMMQDPTASPQILDMLNTKYIIGQDNQTGALVPYKRDTNLGNAWFVDEIKFAANADEELAMLADLDPSTTAVIQKKYEDYLSGFQPVRDSVADQSNSIRMTAYHPDKMEYEYSAGSEQLAVFSEIYYPPSKGWRLLLDGEPHDEIIKANYVLRAVRLPAGDHKLTMEFKPRSFYTGEKISLIGSLLVILGFFTGLVTYFRRKDWSDYNAANIEDAKPEPVKKKLTKTKSTTSKVKRKRPPTKKKKK